MQQPFLGERSGRFGNVIVRNLVEPGVEVIMKRVFFSLVIAGLLIPTITVAQGLNDSATISSSNCVHIRNLNFVTRYFDKKPPPRSAEASLPLPWEEGWGEGVIP